MTAGVDAGARPRDPGLSLLILVATILVAAVVALAGCGSTTSTGTPRVLPPAASPSAGAAGATGGASGSPSPTRWPGTTVQAVIALGAGDSQIAKAASDLQEAASNKDLPAMRGAAAGLVKLLDDLAPSLGQLSSFPHTQPLVQQYGAALAPLRAGAAQVRDSIDTGNADGIVVGFQQISQGMTLYGKARPLLSSLVEEATAQEHFLLK